MLFVCTQFSCATSLGQSGAEGNSNGGIHRILSIIGASLLDCLVSYLGHLYRDAVGVFYNSSGQGNKSRPGSYANERVLRIPQSSSITRASLSNCWKLHLDTRWVSLTPLQKCSRCILQLQSTGLDELNL